MLTCIQSTEGWSSAESPPPAILARMTSPRVTVSVWKDGKDPVHTVERSFTPGTEGSRNIRISNDDALSVETLHGSLPSVSRDTHGKWMPDRSNGQRGIGPGDRSAQETLSVNHLAAARQTDQRNEEVASWVSDTLEQSRDTLVPDSTYHSVDPRSATDDNIPDTEIPLGNTTVNRHMPNQVYYRYDFDSGETVNTTTGGFSQVDRDIMPIRNWSDAPMVHKIHEASSEKDRSQPATSHDAMIQFERMNHDNASIVSHAATWGTRRRSLPSLLDTEGVISGSLFKKLSIKPDSSARRPSILKWPSLVRRPSATQLLKRKGSHGDEAAVSDESGSNERLAPPTRTPSWGIGKKPTPSLNTAIVGMATGAASIGASHARSGSISATSLASPKSPFGFAPVKNTLRRPRSKTEIPKSQSSHPNIVDLLKKAGGPPVAQLAKSQPLHDLDDDDDDDEDTFDDTELKVESGRFEEIVPTLEGFQQHILRLNPALANMNAYLVERIAHQMVVRYKTLQNQKIKHLKAARLGTCVSGSSLCLAQGGSAVLENKGDSRGDLSAQPDSSDSDAPPLEGGINVETFPTGIPMPPTTVLPAVSIILSSNIT